MSRYGKTAVPVPKGVEIKKVNEKITVKGPKGELSLDVKEGIGLNRVEDKVYVELEEGSSLHDAMQGLYRSLINNMIEGVSKGYERKLNLVGVGYRAAIAGHHLDLQLGFSHPTRIEIPKDIKVSVDKATVITVQGIDKAAVGQFCATVRGVRPPEPYKGKGVRYENEVVRKKAGKAAKGKKG